MTSFRRDVIEARCSLSSQGKREHLFAVLCELIRHRWWLHRHYDEAPWPISEETVDGVREAAAAYEQVRVALEEMLSAERRFSPIAQHELQRLANWAAADRDRCLQIVGELARQRELSQTAHCSTHGASRN